MKVRELLNTISSGIEKIVNEAVSVFAEVISVFSGELSILDAGILSGVICLAFVIGLFVVVIRFYIAFEGPIKVIGNTIGWVLFAPILMVEKLVDQSRVSPRLGRFLYVFTVLAYVGVIFGGVMLVLWLGHNV